RARLGASANGLGGTYAVTARAAGAVGGAFVLTNVPSPAVVGLQSFGAPHHPTTLVLTFSEPMDAAPAEDPANYRLLGAGRDPTLGTQDDRVIWIRRARYDAALHSVMLRPVRRLSRHRAYGSTVVGTPPRGLTNAAGTFLAGAGPGRWGSNYAVR